MCERVFMCGLMSLCVCDCVFGCAHELVCKGASTATSVSVCDLPDFMSFWFSSKNLDHLG